MDFGLSVLDVSPVSSGSNGAQALRNTLELSRLSDHGLRLARQDFLSHLGRGWFGSDRLLLGFSRNSRLKPATE
jgi:hypothetical protein